MIKNFAANCSAHAREYDGSPSSDLKDGPAVKVKAQSIGK